MFTTAWTWLTGKKTYIIGGCTIVYAGLGMFLGHVDQDTGMQMIFGALGVMGIRHGMTTQGEPRFPSNPAS